MLAGLVALLAAAAEALVPPSSRFQVRVPLGQPNRKVTRCADPWLTDKEKQTEGSDDPLSWGTDLVEEIKDKLERYTDTMWLSADWLQKAQTTMANMQTTFQQKLQEAERSAKEALQVQLAAERSAKKATEAAAAASVAKAQLESEVRIVEIEAESARLERAEACARAEEFEAQAASAGAQLALREEELESTKADLEEACNVARETVSYLDDALEGTQDNLSRVQRALDDKTTEAKKLLRTADKARQKAAKIEAAREGALAEADRTRQEIAETRADLDRQRKALQEENRKLRDAAALESVSTAAAMAKVAEVSMERDAVRMETDALSTERDAALARAAELQAALAEAQLPKRAKLRRFFSQRLFQPLRRKFGSTTPGERAFQRSASGALARLHDTIDDARPEWVDEICLDDDVFTLKVLDRGTYVIKKDFATQRIWYSSPVSGAQYFSLRADGTWASDALGGRLLAEVLSTELASEIPEARELARKLGACDATSADKQ